MAKIVPSSLAPSEPLRFTLAATSFELGGSKTSAYETDDPDVLIEARIHPWLDVQVDKVEAVEGLFVQQLDPAKDPLSSAHENARLATDPEAARKFQAEQLLIDPVAIEAGLDQDEKVEAGAIAQTFAAAEAHEAEAKNKLTSKKGKE